MSQLLNQICPNVVEYFPELLQALTDTLWMVGISGFFAIIIGLPIGVLLVVTREGHLLQNKALNLVLGKVINVFRSIPFIILLAFIMPLTRAIVGTTIGLKGAIVPLVIGTAPFVARQVESALLGVDPGVIEAAKAMGSSPFEIIYRVLLREGLGGIIYGLTITTVSLIGFSAIAGNVGGGGLGDFAIRYGYQYYKGDIMVVTVIIIIILVSIVQSIGEALQRKVSH
ncbi:MAG: methionine ABC transporter permease [Turicibacter sp.]|nr:methionine ABC transporter permease [Turicibacter sp.]